MICRGSFLGRSPSAGRHCERFRSWVSVEKGVVEVRRGLACSGFGDGRVVGAGVLQREERV